MSKFTSSLSYWENRYLEGGNSGKGSYGLLAKFKAAFLNGFVAGNGISRVVELGCGDGNQLRYARYPSYLGYDVSRRAVEICRSMYRDDASKRFEMLEAQTVVERAPLSLSLDVVYHLVEDDVFATHMRRLFDCSERFVIIYASNQDRPASTRTPHVRHRRFTDWVGANVAEFQYLGCFENAARGRLYEGNKVTTPADFYLFVRSGEVDVADVSIPSSFEL